MPVYSDVRPVITYYNTGTMSFDVWDGSLQAGALTIGAVTQAGSWTVTANAGTDLNTAALALESGGNLAGAATSLAVLDNFISGSRGLVTEDNSAAMAASLAALDNAVAGNELQVDVLTMPTVAVTQSGTWDEVGINDSGNSITVDGTVAVTHAALTELGTAIDTEMQCDIVGALPAGGNNIGDVDVLTAVATGFDHGSNRDVDASAEQITTTSVVASYGVLVKASLSNTGRIYVGNSDVTADTTDATDGFELYAGESVLVKVNNANKVYVIGSTTNQKVFWVTV